MARKLNGPGGKIEPDETPEQAAAREWSEEVVGATAIDDWSRVLVAMYSDATVYFLTSKCSRDHGAIVTVDGNIAVFVDPRAVAQPNQFAVGFDLACFIAMAR